MTIESISDISAARDFALAAPAILRLMEKDPRIVLRIVGFLDVGPDLNRFRDRIEVFPLQDFLNLQRLIAEVEINIAPLQDNTFTNCKSELKYFEAAICGTLTVASPTFTFAASIEHGHTGLLAQGFDWSSKLEEAVSIVDSRAAYTAMACAAHDAVVERYGWDKHVQTIIDAVFS